MVKTKNILFHCLVLFGCAQTKLSLYLRFKIQTPSGLRKTPRKISHVNAQFFFLDKIQGNYLIVVVE